MLRSLKTIHGAPVAAMDGSIGHVARFLIDIDAWTVRYLVVDAGGFWQGHEVVISPMSITGRIDSGGALPLSLTREAIRNSPPYDPLNPFTRDKEAALLAHYGYAQYWNGPFLWGPYPTPAGTEPRARPIRDRVTGAAVLDQPAAHELASSRTVIGIHIHARDGDIGHVEDCLAEGDTWRIRYMVVDTSNWWVGRRVLISPEWVERFEWAGRRLDVGLEKAQIQGAPEFRDAAHLTREQEASLHRYYDRAPYWGREPDA